MKRDIFAEIGIGNGTFFSTEFECGEYEYRIPVLFVGKVRSKYVRLWVGKKVFVWDSVDGFKIKTKTKRNFKVLIGIWSVE